MLPEKLLKNKIKKKLEKNLNPQHKYYLKLFKNIDIFHNQTKMAV